MAQDTISIPNGVWTLVTQTNVSSLRIQNQSGYDMLAQATASPAVPEAGDAGFAGSILIQPYGGWDSDILLSTRFVGVSGANRIYVYCTHNDVAKVSVSYV